MGGKRAWADANLKKGLPRLERARRAIGTTQRERETRMFHHYIGRRQVRIMFDATGFVCFLRHNAPVGLELYHQVWSRQPTLAREEDQQPPRLTNAMHCHSPPVLWTAVFRGWLSERAN